MTEGQLHALRSLASKATSVNGARLTEFMFLHLAIFVIIALVSSTFYLVMTTSSLGFLLIGALSALAIFSAWAATSFFQAAIFADQHGRDLKAHRIVKRVLKNGRAGNFGVLIRPFSNNDLIASNALPAVPYGRLLSSGPVFAGPAKPAAMEPQLNKAVEDVVGPLVTLGAPTFAPGAGRAPVSVRDWEKTVGELADSASLIFFTPGIDKESKQALSELLDSDIIRRTVIVEPGARDEPNANDVEAVSVIRWNSLRALFADHGYALPPKSEHGALIYFGVAGAEPRVLSFGIWQSRPLRLFLNFVAKNAKQAEREYQNRIAQAEPQTVATPPQGSSAKDIKAA